VTHTHGVLLHKGESGQSECDYWERAPGHWRCQLARDEFCHLLADEACYEHDDSGITQVGTDTAAFFPAGRSGICRITRTVKKAYMIR